MADLKTNYVDDVLDTTKNQLRKYQQIQNDDGTVSFVDVTEYTQVGTSFGAKDINDTNAAINDVNGKLENIFQGYKVAIFCENILFTNGEAYYNTGFKNYKKFVVLVSNSGNTTKISATIPTESKGVIKLTATKFDGSSPTYTDTITMLVAYLE